MVRSLIGREFIAMRFYALYAGQKSLWCPSSRPSSSLDDSTRNINQDAGTPSRSRNAAYAMRTMTSLRDSSLPFSNSNHNSHASHKSFRTKQKMAKAGKQNRPVPGWIRLRTNNPIRYATICLRSSQNDRKCHPLQVFDPNLQRQEKALEKDSPQHLSNSPLEPHFRIWDCCRKRSTTTMVLAFQR
ncbi:hypothetical protein E4U32_001827 [Claviceps aff. humidiphila group G2b]|nr:hypothetical protein E4U32_001827 [Claviceps aff. humidiphila group G2b]